MRVLVVLRRKPTLDGIQCPFLVVSLEVPHLLPHDQGKLHLIVKIYPLGTDTGTGPREHDGGRRLEEKEGLFWPYVVQLGHMVART